MLEAVLFDLDGLIVDSEPLQFRAYQFALDRFGIALDHDAWIQWHLVEASTARWIRDRNLDLDPAELREVKKDYYDELIETEMQLKPGARELIEACSKEFTLAVVSSSRIESIEGCLRKFSLHGFFSELVSATALARAKPFPDPYLEALKALGLGPGQAIALEDSVTGLKASLAAGIDCVVCPDHFIPKPEGAFEGAAGIVDSLRELDCEALREFHRSRRLR